MTIGLNKVNMAVTVIPKPKIVVAPNLRASIPPNPPNKYPIENTLKMNPFIFISQLNSACWKLMFKTIKYRAAYYANTDVLHRSNNINIFGFINQDLVLSYFF